MAKITLGDYIDALPKGAKYSVFYADTLEQIHSNQDHLTVKRVENDVNGVLLIYVLP